MIKHIFALRFREVLSFANKMPYRMISGIHSTCVLQKTPANASSSSEHSRLEQYYQSKLLSTTEFSNQRRIDSIDSVFKIMEMLQSRSLKLSVNEEIMCLLQINRIGFQTKNIYGLDEAKIKLSKRLKGMESEDDILVGSLCQALLRMMQQSSQEDCKNQQRQKQSAADDWQLWEEICQSVVNNRFQVSSQECYWLVKGLGQYLECAVLLDYQKELVKNSLAILVYPVTVILKTEERNNNSNIFSLEDMREILREFESAQIFSHYLAEAIQEFFAGRNGVLAIQGAKKLINNSSSEQTVPENLGFGNANGLQNHKDLSGDHDDNVQLLERLIQIQNYLSECGVLSEEINVILGSPGNDFDKLFTSSSRSSSSHCSLNSNHRNNSILLEGLRLLRAFRTYGVKNDFLTASVIKTILLLNSEGQRNYSLRELIKILELCTQLCLSEASACVERYIDDLIETQQVDFTLSELQKTQQLRKYQGIQLNILSSRSATARKSTPQETLAFLEFIHSADIYLYFPELLDSLPEYFAGKATHYDFEELCSIYYLLKKEEQMFLTDIHKQNGFLNVLKEYIKINYSQIVSSSKTRGSLPFTSNFFKILTIIDMGELFAESHFS